MVRQLIGMIVGDGRWRFGERPFRAGADRSATAMIAAVLVTRLTC
jgi:hypothetical protein